jgi:hypothetical protein
MLMTLVMGLAVQVLSWAASERKAAAHRAWATEEAINVLERLRDVPPDRLDEAVEAAGKLSERVAGILPDGRVEVTASQPDADDGARRVTVRVRWIGRDGSPTRPVRLTTWARPTTRAEGGPR